ncbi:hypothetical protein F9L00_03635 [Brucella anthropi]|nr:hypothetical protein F9K98_01030 [Brucella anthropi]KAB2782568.1 hypothetical protein F9L00_03635 [Brucella anthropi]
MHIVIAKLLSTFARHISSCKPAMGQSKDASFMISRLRLQRTESNQQRCFFLWLINCCAEINPDFTVATNA